MVALQSGRWSPTLKAQSQGSRAFTWLLVAACTLTSVASAITLSHWFRTLKVGKRVASYSDPLSFHANVEARGPVALFAGETTHFQLETEEGMEEFKAILPSGGHLVYTRSEDNKPEAHTVTLFHQLKCLDILRQQLTGLPSKPSPDLVRHCTNYLRQSLMCRPSMLLEEGVTDEARVSHGGYDLLCNDWSAIYEEAERNHAAWLDWKETRQDL